LKNVAQALNQAFLLTHAPAGAAAVRLQTRLWYNPGVSNPRFFGSGALGMVLILFPALLGALAVAREHEQGTLIQVYASTLSAPQWLLGKALPYMGIGLFELVICFWLGLQVFEYRLPTDPTPMLAGSVLYIAAAVFFGMMAGNLTGSQSAAIQAVQLGGFLASMLLSGFLVPVANIPPELRWISALLPARHYIEITRNSMLRDEGWMTSGRSLLMLAALAALLFLVNCARMRRMQLPA
jgi:ABC-2 type transport system permease protein